MTNDRLVQSMGDYEIARHLGRPATQSISGSASGAHSAPETFTAHRGGTNFAGKLCARTAHPILSRFGK